MVIALRSIGICWQRNRYPRYCLKKSKASKKLDDLAGVQINACSLGVHPLHLKDMRPLLVSLSIAFVAGTSAAWTQMANAGPLAQTARAVDNVDETRESSQSNDDDDDDSDEDSSYENNDSSLYNSSDACIESEGCAPFRLNLPPPKIEVGLTVQKVLHSDGSLHADGIMLFGRVGASAQVDYYYEKISMMHRGSETIGLGLYELAFLGRVVQANNLVVDVRGGLGLSSSTAFKTIAGVVVGGSVMGRLSEHVALRADGRFYALENDIKVKEGVIGAQLSYAWLGYRVMKFSVGERIEGPELGIRMQFE